MDDKENSLKNLKIKINEAEEIESSSIKVGDIIYINLQEEDGLTLKSSYKSRLKYIVIVGFTSKGNAIGALLINSKERMAFHDYQYPLLHWNYLDILDYDSWLDCTTIIELELSKIKARHGKLKGQLIPEDKERINAFLIETDIIEYATKIYFGIIRENKD